MLIDEKLHTEIKKLMEDSKEKLQCGYPIHEWVYGKYMKVYFRITRRYINRIKMDTLEIANVDISKKYRGQKLLTNFIEFLKANSEGRTLYVESVQEPRLDEFLPKVGFTEVPYDYPGGKSYYMSIH